MDLMLLSVEQVSADVKETHGKIVVLEEKIKSSPQIDFDSILQDIHGKIPGEFEGDQVKEI